MRKTKPVSDIARVRNIKRRLLEICRVVAMKVNRLDRLERKIKRAKGRRK